MGLMNFVFTFVFSDDILSTPTESSPKVFQAPGGMTVFLTLLGLILVWIKY